MTNKEFIELAYEIAFGDSAIEKDYSHEEVISRLRNFSYTSAFAEKIYDYASKQWLYMNDCVLEKKNEIN